MPRGSKSDRGRPAQRRKQPQSATGDEGRFLAGRVTAGSRLAVWTQDGERTLGVLRSFNEETIEFQADDRPAVVLRKSQIRAIEEVD